MMKIDMTWPEAKPGVEHEFPLDPAEVKQPWA